MLQPHAEAVEVENVRAGEFLALAICPEALATDETVSGGRQLLGSRVFKALLDVVEQTKILNEGGETFVEGSEGDPNLPIIHSIIIKSSSTII